MQSSGTLSFCPHKTTNITNNVNFSFKIGNRNDRPQVTARSTSQDIQDQLDTDRVKFSFAIGNRNDRPQGTARITSQNFQDEFDTSARNEDETGKSEDIRHGQTHDLRPGNSRNSTNDLGNPRGIRPENECFSEVQNILSQDNIPGEEAIGQYVNIDGKPKGIRPRSRKPMIVEPTPVL